MDYVEAVPYDACNVTKNFAKTVMEYVIRGEVSMIKLIYPSYSGDKDKIILKKALANYITEPMLSPSEFSIKIYGECDESRNTYKCAG